MTSDDVSTILAGVSVALGKIFTTAVTIERKIEKGQSSSGSNAVLELNLTKCTTVDG